MTRVSRSTAESSDLPNGDGSQSMAERNSKNLKPSVSRRARCTSTQRAGSIRMVSDRPGWMCDSTMASPMISPISARSVSRTSSVSTVSSSLTSVSVDGVSVSADDNRITSPFLGHVLVRDPLLEQNDALEEGFGSRRTAGDVDVDGDDLVDALGHRVAVPVRAATVGAATHRDHVLGFGHLVVEATHGRDHLVGDGARNAQKV